MGSRALKDNPNGGRAALATAALASLVVVVPPAAAQTPAVGVASLMSSQGLSAASIAVGTLFLLAVLLESALAIVFNWRPLIESFNARATRPLVSFAVALAFVSVFHFDAVTDLMNALQTPPRAPSGFGYALTAAILAGGSSGVNTMLVALGFRELKTQDTAAPKPDPTQAWVAIRIVQVQTTGEVRVQIGAQTVAAPYLDLPLAGVVPGSTSRSISPIRRFFLRDPGRFPPFGGYIIPSKSPCRIVVSASKNDASNTRVYSDPIDFTPTERAIIDLTVTL